MIYSKSFIRFFMNTIAMRRLGDIWKMSWGTHSNKGSASPPACLQKHPDHKRHLYWWRFLTELLHDKLIINIDEAGFSKSVKTSYSCLLIGFDASIVNEVFGGRTNLILSVYSLEIGSESSTIRPQSHLITACSWRF